MIRIALETDIPAILEIYAPYVSTTTVSFEYEVPSLEAFSQRFSDITGQFPWLVWEENGVILGYAYASRPFTRAAYSWCAEPSIYLRPEARGKGIGKALYTALEALLLAQGYQVLYPGHRRKPGIPALPSEVRLPDIRGISKLRF